MEISQQKIPSPPAKKKDRWQNNEALKSYQDLEVPMGESFLQFWWPCFSEGGIGVGIYLLIDYSDVNMVLKPRSTPNECQTLFN